MRKILSSPRALAVSGYDDEIRLGLAIEQHDRNNLHIGVDSTLFTPGRHGRFDLPCQRAVSQLEMPYLFATLPTHLDQQSAIRQRSRRRERQFVGLAAFHVLDPFSASPRRVSIRLTHIKIRRAITTATRRTMI
jgi:hypothetical protein